MNWLWGLMLLADGDKTEEGTTSDANTVPQDAAAEDATGVFQTIGKFIFDAIDDLIDFFGRLLYGIWLGIANVACVLEDLFKRLAGLDTSNGNMTTKIINDIQVQAVFQNLVGVATVLLIFFTIVKIVQQHYKEKDGGNPYIIVFRMFKGFLMFFFVTATVAVGLYGTGVVFRALDSATGGGQTSVAGQVFKQMAYDANRLRQGAPAKGWKNFSKSLAFNKLMGKEPLGGLEDNSEKDLRYTMTCIRDSGVKTSASEAELQARTYAQLPISRWVKVNDDGSYTGLVPSYNLRDDDPNDDWKKGTFYDINYHTNTLNQHSSDSDWSDGTAGAHNSVGYQSDLLQYVDIKVKPQINIEYSPIKVKEHYWELVEASAVTNNKSAMGTGFSYGFQNYKYKMVHNYELPISEANFFSINLNGGVSIQGDTAAATFDLDMFKSTMPVQKILLTLLANVAITLIVELLFQKLPQLPTYVHIDGNGINLGGMIMSEIIGPPVNAAMTSGLAQLLDKASGTDDGLHIDPKSSVVFVEVGKGDSGPVTVWPYDFDKNFEDLWGTLAGAWDGLRKELQDKAALLYNLTMGWVDKAIQKTAQITSSTDWIEYIQYVDMYNVNASEYVRDILNYMSLVEFYDPAFADVELKRVVVESWRDLVNLYDLWRKVLKRPTARYAQSFVVGEVYKPIFEIDKSFLNTAKALVPDGRLTDAEVASYYTHLKEDFFGIEGVKDDPGFRFNVAHYSNILDEHYICRVIDWEAYNTDRSWVTYFPDKFPNGFDDLAFVGNTSSWDAFWQERLQSVADNSDIERLKEVMGKTMPKFDARFIINIDSLVSSEEYLNWIMDNYVKQGDVSEWDTLLRQAMGMFASRVDFTTFIGDTTESEIYTNGSSGVMSATVVDSDAAQISTMADASSEFNIDDILNSSTVSQGNSNVITTFDSRDIVTFRTVSDCIKMMDRDDISNPTTQGDIKALNTWLKRYDKMTTPAGKTVSNYFLGAQNNGDIESNSEMIDWYMATSLLSRNYLTVSNIAEYLASGQQGNGGVLTDPGAILKNYVGVFSWQDSKTVMALYYISDMNWFIGFAGITVAIGVYLNFTFGLIQRAVNIAVLYMMSPLTIAFYPFDDGASFKNNFVKAFYTQCISAFGTIISLNFFLVLIGTVQRAAKEVTGYDMMELIALMAFCSMLPSIRQLVCKTLGAEDLKSVSPKQMWDSAVDATLGSGGLGLNGVASKVKGVTAIPGKVAGAFGGAVANKVRDNFYKNAAQWREKNPVRKLGSWVKNKVGNAFSASDETKKEWQANVESVLAGEKDEKELGRKEKRMLKLARKQALKGMSQTDQAAAMGESWEDLKKRAEAGDVYAKSTYMHYTAGVGDSEAVAKKKWEAERQKKLNAAVDAQINSSVLAGTHDKVGRNLLQWMGDGALVVKRAGTKAGDAVGSFFKYTPVDSVINALGAGFQAARDAVPLLHWMDKKTAFESMKKRDAEDAQRRAFKMEPMEVRMKQFYAANEALLEAEHEFEDNTRALAALKQANAMDIDDDEYKKRWLALAVAADKSDRSEAEKMAAAENDWNTMDAETRRRLFEERGGINQFAEDLRNGVGGLEIKNTFMAAAKEEMEGNAKLSVEQLQGNLKDIKGNRDAAEFALSQVAATLGVSTDALGGDAQKALIDYMASGKGSATEIAALIAGATGGSQSTALSALQNAGVLGGLEGVQRVARMNNFATSGAIDYLKKRDKSREYAHEDMGVDIDTRAFSAQFQAYRRAHDTRYKGGMIDQENQLYDDLSSGKIGDAEYHRQLNRLHAKFEGDLDAAIRNCGSVEDARKFDYGVRQLQREDAEMKVLFGKQLQNRMDYQLHHNMSGRAKQALFQSAARQKFVSDNDFVGAERMMKKAITAAMEHRWDDLYASGLDKHTADTYRSWAETGGAQGMEDLKQTLKFNDLSREFFGDPKGGTTGNAMQASRNQVAAIWRMAETQEAVRHFNEQANDMGRKAGVAQNTIINAMSSMKGKFTGKAWDIVGDMLDIKVDGKKLGHGELEGYMQKQLEGMLSGAVDPMSKPVQDLITGLNRVGNEWNSNAQLKEIMQANQAAGMLNSIVGALGAGETMVKCGMESDQYRAQAQEMLKKDYMAFKRLNSGGGKKG